jgi:hypothetical protein
LGDTKYHYAQAARTINAEGGAAVECASGSNAKRAGGATAECAVARSC